MANQHAVPTTSARTAQSQRVTRTKRLFTVYEAVWFLLGIIEVLLGFRFIFRLLGANPASAFVDALYSVSGMFLAPFFGIFGTPTLGAAAFETTTLVAMAVYAAGTMGLIRLIRLLTTSSEEAVARNIQREEQNL
jgi:hypothetical protein